MIISFIANRKLSPILLLLWPKLICFSCVYQERLFCELVFLCRNANGGVQSATREALMRIDVSFLLLVKCVNHVLSQLSVLLFVFFSMCVLLFLNGCLQGI